MQLPLPDLAATERLGAALAEMACPGDVILLEGALGAGKSALARALIRAALRDPALEVPSPTYTLVQSYEGPSFTIHHLDLWRLDGPASLHELGWDEMRQDLVLVEWPGRLGLNPEGALLIDLAPGPSLLARDAEILGWDSRRMANLKALLHVADPDTRGPP